MQRWADYLDKLRLGANVVVLRSARSMRPIQPGMHIFDVPGSDASRQLDWDPKLSRCDFTPKGRGRERNDTGRRFLTDEPALQPAKCKHQIAR